MTEFESNLPEGFEMPDDPVGKRILKEYGALFVAKGVEVPKSAVFRGEDDVRSFQSRLSVSSETMGGFEVVLQSRALEALRKAKAEAREAGKDVTPRGSDSAKRAYRDTVGLWESRIGPGLKHWVGQGRLSQSEADRIRSLEPFAQVPEILKLEQAGMFFSKDLSKTVLYSVAPPGTSQHLSMLALDINEFNDREVIAIMNRNGWFQTVVSDLPHFTFLGLGAGELASRGLTSVRSGGREFWIPRME